MNHFKPANVAPVTEGIQERIEYGVVILSPSAGQASRRVVFVNNYGGLDVWKKVKAGEIPPHHLWGCLDLVRMGYEVALAEEIPDFNRRRKPLPHDLRLFKIITKWLRKGDIVYCGHNVLFWIPFLRSLGLVRSHIVSLLFARENLAFSNVHSAVIALTPVAAAQAAMLAPKAKIAHLGWGVELNSFPSLPYDPQYFLHCGIAGRDFTTLQTATTLCNHRVRIIASQKITDRDWPTHVEIIDSGPGYNHTNKKVSFNELINQHYKGAAASLIVTIPNPGKDHALGFTNLIEALALGKPIIHTRTGALADEIDVEKEGCGLAIPPNDPTALASAMSTIMNDRAGAEAMGKAARKLCEARYNIGTYARRLHQLFESL